MGPDAIILVFWMLSFKPTFLLSSFTFIKRLFNYSLLSAVRVVPSAYLRLLIFPLAILIPACASSSLAFSTMYSAYLEKEMAIHSSTLAWKIPWTEEPDRLQSMGSQRVGHVWATGLNWSLSRSQHQQPSVQLVWSLSLVAQRLKRLPPTRETRVWSLGREDSLEKEMVTHPSILAWRIPRTEKPGGLPSLGSHWVRHSWGDLTAAAAGWS